MPIPSPYLQYKTETSWGRASLVQVLQTKTEGRDLGRGHCGVIGEQLNNK